jgi:alkaline phosphatase
MRILSMKPAVIFFVLLFAAATVEIAAPPGEPIDWYAQGQAAVRAAEKNRPIRARAKNVILFLGDGLSFSTVTAARIFEGQQRGEPGEENLLSFETFPHTAWLKTYNTDLQVADSAGTMTAVVTGEKTRVGMISVNQKVWPGDISTLPVNSLATILELAERNGLSTGVVTTSRLTHATPAACYAHSPDRNWEMDSLLPEKIREANFPDIARQLIEFPDGDGLEVALGGGRFQFLPREIDDPEEPDWKGGRNDGRNLTAEWMEKPGAAYVWNRDQFAAIDPAVTDHLLGLFEVSHMQFEHDRRSDRAGEPSLTEMTIKALDILKKNPKGYFLMVESGRIDHAHHVGNAYRALVDTVEFARAVLATLDRVDLRDTLVVVTSDHSHVLTISGYPARGNPILGKVVSIDASGNREEDFERDALGLPFTTLNYMNGPGYTGASDDQPEGPKRFPHAVHRYSGITRGRPDLTAVATEDPDYLQEAGIPMGGETHSGEDVPVYAAGPKAYLVHGVQEQSFLFHVMAEAFGFSRKNKKPE